jgi:hypothetical protein
MGGAGVAGTTGTAGAAQEPEPAGEPWPLDSGGLPLFVGDGGGALAPEPDADGTLHLSFDDDVTVVTISTHIHSLDLTDLFASVAFEVRTSRETTLIVAVTPILTTSYAEDIANGYTWMGDGPSGHRVLHGARHPLRRHAAARPR